MEIQITFPNIDVWLTKNYNAWVKYLFTKPGIISFIALSVFGLLCFCIQSPSSLQLMSTHQYGLYFLYAYLLSLIFIPLHELGHAFMTKFYGREVGLFGIGWYWVAPIAFVDTTDMCLSSSKQRLVVDLAGIFVNLAMGGIFSILAILSSNQIYSIFFWLIALMNYWSVYACLDPTLEFDGYYALADYFDRPNLREDATVWLFKKIPTCIQQPSLFKKYKYELLYWLTCALFIFLRAGVVFLLQKILVEYYVSAQWWYKWQFVLPLIITVISFLSVWVDAKKHIRNIETN